MNKKVLRGSFLLLLGAGVWGVAFVAQSVGMDHLNAFAFNSIRNFIGVLVLLPVLFIKELIRLKKNKDTPFFHGILTKDLLIGGLCCGTALSIASNFQQLGIEHSTVGKSAFITTLYIIMVPLLGIFLKKKVAGRVWFSVALALVGLFLLCMKNERFVLETADIYLILCAFFFSIQIICVDHFAAKTDGIALSIFQFLVTGILSGVGMIATDGIPNLSEISAAAVPLLYAGGISCGIGYTMQILAQKDVPATLASLIMSLESVVAALAGWLFLQEVLTTKETFGCILVFIAIILAQLPARRKRNKKK